MKLKKLAALIRSYFTLGGTPVNTASFAGDFYQLPPGMTADDSALFGLIGGLLNANESNDMDVSAIAGAASTDVTLTPAQATSQIVDYGGAPGGGVTLRTGTAAAIIAALPSTIPVGGYNFMQFIMNDNAGQTLTLTAGTGVTITGTATIATNTVRIFVVNVNTNTGRVTWINLGTWNL